MIMHVDSGEDICVPSLLVLSRINSTSHLVRKTQHAILTLVVLRNRRDWGDCKGEVQRGVCE